MLSAEPRSSGVYGLFCLDGAPVAATDAYKMGMEPPPTNQSWLMEGHDTYAPEVAQLHSDANGSTLIVGQISGTDDLAARLGLVRDAPTAHIARTALARFGADTPAEMLGEWSLLHRSVNGRVTVMAGPAVRDRLHYALVGPRLAVAPNLFSLAQIDWVGVDVDEAGLLMQLGRAYVRESRGDRTMLKRVRWLTAGTSVVIEPDGRIAKFAANALIPQPRWKGSFADALAESEALLRQIMRERMAGVSRPAVMLSGGLDSSLLAWLAKEELTDNQTVSAITSAAPIGSGIDDETPFARQVTDHLGIDCTQVAADLSADFFRPPDAVLSGASGPGLSNRHCLTEAFQIAAKANGSTLMINGTYGEMSATVRLPMTGLALRMRRFVSQIYHGLRHTEFAPSETGHFHVRVAPHRLANLPEPIVAAIDKEQSSVPRRYVPKSKGLLGYVPGALKSLIQSNEFYPGAVRMDYPFRDIRLYRLFAGFPVEMLLKGGHDRPVVRAILEGRLPDSIRLRRRGMPAEPDRYQRMQRQASAARARIAEFRKAEVDDWIDIDWLDSALSRIAERGAASNGESNEVQLTAIAAEFLYWWRTRS